MQYSHAKLMSEIRFYKISGTTCLNLEYPKKNLFYTLFLVLYCYEMRLKSVSVNDIAFNTVSFKLGQEDRLKISKQ